uniref:Uncharacterized protein n=1 Tax=Cacopsylla melanoneura TaxID=428564 RepID=A0A8D9AXF5_9HEMI
MSCYLRDDRCLKCDISELGKSKVLQMRKFRNKTLRTWVRSPKQAPRGVRKRKHRLGSEYKTGFWLRVGLQTPIQTKHNLGIAVQRGIAASVLGSLPFGETLSVVFICRV